VQQHVLPEDALAELADTHAASPAFKALKHGFAHARRSRAARPLALVHASVPAAAPTQRQPAHLPFVMSSEHGKLAARTLQNLRASLTAPPPAAAPPTRLLETLGKLQKLHEAEPAAAAACAVRLGAERVRRSQNVS